MSAIPVGLCQCGCGGTTTVAAHTDRNNGRVKGQPVRFINGHSGRVTTRRGAGNPAWAGGRRIATNGYAVVRASEHPAAYKGYVYEHRLVMEEHLGRMLEPDEQIHHRNGDKTDNRLENLALVTSAEHGVHHRKRTDLRLPGEQNQPLRCACGCGGELLKYDSAGRPRRFLPHHHSKVLGEAVA